MNSIDTDKVLSLLQSLFHVLQVFALCLPWLGHVLEFVSSLAYTTPYIFLIVYQSVPHVIVGTLCFPYTFFIISLKDVFFFSCGY